MLKNNSKYRDAAPLKSCCSVNGATQAEDVKSTGYLDENACG